MHNRTGISEDEGHFNTNIPKFRAPPFNMISNDEAWYHFKLENKKIFIDFDNFKSNSEILIYEFSLNHTIFNLDNKIFQKNFSMAKSSAIKIYSHYLIYA